MKLIYLIRLYTVLTIFSDVHCLSGKHPDLLYANIDQIDSIEVGTWTNSTLVPGLSRAISLDYHYMKGYIFWTDVLKMKISVTHINNALRLQEGIVRTKISRPDGIAIDWIYNHLYWTDEVFQHIQVSNLDGSMRRTLIDYAIERPRALALDPVNRKMFFSDWGTVPRIERCGLDGQDREVIVHTDIAWPNGMVIDHEANRLYWTDGYLHQIKSSTFDGKDVRTLIKDNENLPHPFGIAVHDQMIYWTNWEYKSILRTNKHKGSKVEIVRSDLKSPMDLKLYHKNVQRTTDDNVCGFFNGGCSHLCLPSSPWTTNKGKFSCMCPDGYGINSDNKTCDYNGRDIKLLIAEHQSISQIDLDSIIVEKLNLPSLLNTVAVDFHFEKDLMFWTDVLLQKIYVSYLSGGLLSGLGVRQPIFTDNIKTPDGLAVDWIYNHLYWTDTGFDHVQISNLDGTHRKTLIYTNLDEPRALALFPQEGIMFFTDWGIFPKIERCNMDGTERKIIVSDDIKWPNGIVIDYTAKRIYWTDGYLQAIKSATFDGKDIYAVVQFTKDSWPQPFGIDIFEDQIYWSNWNSKNVYTMHKYKGNNMKPFVTGLEAPRNIKILSKSSQNKGSNLCGSNNGGCDHLCIPVPATVNKKGFTCQCADSYSKEETNKCVKKEAARLMKEEL